MIDRCFAGEEVAAIRAALAAEGGAWAAAARATLEARPPFSLAVTLRAIRAGRDLSVAACLVQDYRICRRFLGRADLYEGIRAAVIDKGATPRWRPARLADVDPDEVAACFAPLGAEDLVLPARA